MNVFGLNIFYFKHDKGLGKEKVLHEPYPKTKYSHAQNHTKKEWVSLIILYLVGRVAVYQFHFGGLVIIVQ